MKVSEFLESTHYVGEVVTLRGRKYILTKQDVIDLEDIRDYVWYCQDTATLAKLYEYSSESMKVWIVRINMAVGLKEYSHLPL